MLVPALRRASGRGTTALTRSRISAQPILARVVASNPASCAPIALLSGSRRSIFNALSGADKDKALLAKKQEEEQAKAQKRAAAEERHKAKELAAAEAARAREAAREARRRR